MTIGDRVRAARRRSGMTQKQLGDALGITPQSVAQWEKNLRNPKFETLRRIADALGISIKELLPPEEGTAFFELPDEDSDRIAEEGCQLLRYTLGERGRKIAVSFMRELAYNPENLLINDKRMKLVDGGEEEVAEHGQYAGEDE